MQNPQADTPETIVPSEPTSGVAVDQQLAAAAEVAAGIQSPTPEEDFSLEAALAAIDAEEAALAAANAGQVPPTAQAAVPPVAPDPAAGVAAVEDQTTEHGEKHGPQHRIRPRSETDAAVLALMSRNQDMTLEEALAKVKGPTTPQEAAAQADATPAPAAVTAASTLDALTARQEELKQRLQAAHDDMDFSEAGKIQAEILDLIEQKAEAKVAKAQAEAAEIAAWNQQVAAAEAKALALYPGMEAPNSAHYAKMEAIHAIMERENDPLIHRADYAIKLAQMAAAELGIAPRTSSPAPAVTQAAAPTRPLMNVRPAAGGTISGAAPTQAAAELMSQMDKWTVEDWEEARLSGKFNNL